MDRMNSDSVTVCGYGHDQQATDKGMSMRDAYLAHMKSTTPATSNKATSYVRALDLLAQVLVSDGTDFWAIRDGAALDALYAWSKTAQKDTSSRLYADGMPRSYASGGYYSAALSEYRTFMGGR